MVEKCITENPCGRIINFNENLEKHIRVLIGLTVCAFQIAFPLHSEAAVLAMSVNVSYCRVCWRIDPISFAF